MSGHALSPSSVTFTGFLVMAEPAWPRVVIGFAGCQSSAASCHVAPVRLIAAGTAPIVAVTVRPSDSVAV